MLDNRAQSLVVFIILLPLFVLLVGYVFDVFNLNYEKQKLNNIVELSKSNYSDYTESNYCDIVYRNDSNAICVVEANKIIVTKKVKSLFSTIIGKKYFDIKVEVNV